MILAGVDEAGYGPVLGPLVVGCCAFELSDEQAEAQPDAQAEADAQARTNAPDGETARQLPCLWRLLRRTVSKNRLRGGRKLHINDSKAVYSPNIGLKELERSVLAVAMAKADDGQKPCANLPSFLRCVAEHVLPELDDYAWYKPFGGESFPIEQEAASIATMANALKKEMRAQSAACLHLGAQVMLERRLNRMWKQTRNKSDTLFSISAIHLDYLLRNFGAHGLTIVCDRQGGRGYYGPLLMQMFQDWSLEILSERESISQYRLRKDGHAVRIIFSEKAESLSLPAAMASMLSKYVREALMRRFNAYWQSHLPQVHPTAGYYNDGLRFLRDIESKRRELGVRDEDLIRSR